MKVPAEYQTSDQVKTARRPNRSASEPNSSAPTNRPAKVMNTKVPAPLAPAPDRAASGPSCSGVNRPSFTRPGTT